MSELDKQNNRDYSVYDNMSIEDLEYILRMDSQMPEDETSDLDTIMYIMEVIAGREKERPSGRFSDVDKAWKSFNENYRPYIDDGKSLYDDEVIDPEESNGIEKPPFITVRHEKKKITRNTFSRTIGVVAAIIAIVFIGTMTAYALGFDLWGAVAAWTKDTFGFVDVYYDGEEDNTSTNTDSEYYSMQDALDGYGVTETLAPTWIPAGYYPTSTEVTDSPLKIFFTAVYTDDNEELIIKISSFSSGAASTFEKDDEAVDIYEINGVTHYIMSNNGRIKAIWMNGNNECSITGNITRDEIIRMIDSIYER